MKHRLICESLTQHEFRRGCCTSPGKEPLYCLIEVCLAWGGRSIVLAQSLLEHGSASVAFDDYCPVLDTVAALLPANVQVLLLADRGFEHGELIRWLDQAHWDWGIRAKSDLVITLNQGLPQSVAALLPTPGQAHLYHNVQILGDINCHLATRFGILEEKGRTR
jgi:hypothetical protein